MTTLITGASRGIGFAMAVQLAARGERVVALNRTASPELATRGVQVRDGIELTDVEGVAALAAGFVPGSLDRIIANAGLRIEDDFADFRLDDLRRQFEVNALAPLNLVRALAPALKDGGKVALISTRVGSLADNGRGGEFGYRMSKAALNMAGVNLAHALKPRGIGVFLLHPGFVRTDLTGGQGLIDAAESAAKLIAMTDDLTIAETGSFWHAIERTRLPW